MSTTSPSHQTIRLSRGRHATPADGACVMELASMLAGERFSDRPRAACPVIGMVLRAYNDAVDDERRQDLYAYAAAVVGTRDRRRVADRLRRCEEFFADGLGRRGLLRRARLHAVGRAALAYGRDSDADAHREFLRLVDELVGTDDASTAMTADRCRDKAAH